MDTHHSTFFSPKEQKKIIHKKMARIGLLTILKLRRLLRWCLLALLIGIVLGGIGAAFVHCIQTATDLRTRYPWLILLLPLGGVLIVWLYRITHNHNDKGTNMVLASLRSEAELPAQMAPLIFVSTTITHLFGGSAGREGAALQLGGSIGNLLARGLRFKKLDTRILILAGMSAAFAAIFGTPIAAAIFVMEVSCIGAMRYSALVPCAVSSLTASYIAQNFGAHAEHYTIAPSPALSLITGLQTLLLGVLCAAVSILFCTSLHRSEHLMEKHIRNPYLRIAAAGAIVILLGFLFRSYDYFGTGTHIIEQAVTGEVIWYAFLVKIVFTAVTIGGGFKGGEIVPSFFIGATFGCIFGQLTGLSPSLCAAVGMITMFCSVTNCPIASLLIAAELFGMDYMGYFLLAIAVSYLLSGYHGLYKEQKFMYSKFSDARIQHKTKD